MHHSEQLWLNAVLFPPNDTNRQWMAPKIPRKENNIKLSFICSRSSLPGKFFLSPPHPNSFVKVRKITFKPFPAKWNTLREEKHSGEEKKEWTRFSDKSAILLPVAEGRSNLSEKKKTQRKTHSKRKVFSLREKCRVAAAADGKNYQLNVEITNGKKLFPAGRAGLRQKEAVIAV